MARCKQKRKMAVDQVPVLIAVTGASGTIYSKAFLEILHHLEVKTELIISSAGQKVAALELGSRGFDGMKALAQHVYNPDNIAAKPASGSARYHAMIVLPCTMGTLAAIANGISTNLIHRAADCSLKERRQLVLVIRETPFNRTHVKNMLAAQEAGAVIYPAMPSFYHKPKSLDEMAYFFAGRLAEFLGFSVPDLKRWQG